MNSNNTDIEQMELDGIKRYVKVLLEALSICCEERNSVVQIQKSPAYFINEAIEKT